MSKTSIFFGGVPTAPQVKKLVEHFGIPKEGVLIEWAEIEEVIGEPKGSNRFSSILTSWRRQLDDEHNIEMIAVLGRGLKAADPDERNKVASGHFRKSVRSLGRCVSVAERTDASRLNEEGKKLRTWLTMSAAKLQLHAINSQKKLPSGE